jgi:hypothetical protein
MTAAREAKRVSPKAARLALTRYRDNKESHYVYRCYGPDDQLLYVGCTVEVQTRIWNHRYSPRRASRWLTACMDRYEVSGPYPGRIAGREVERQAIQTEGPLFNQQETLETFDRTLNQAAVYLIAHGHVDLARETTCTCWTETKELGAFDEWCALHVTLHDLANAAASA